MIIRTYAPEDCPELAALFYDTVHSVCAGDYTREQLDAWATGHTDLDAWDRSFRDHHTVVAQIDGVIAGFGDMDRTGYLDRLYVHRDFQRMGVAMAICDALECVIPARRYTTHASITARPFFARRGYQVVRAQQVIRCGVTLTNFLMEKQR